MWKTVARSLLSAALMVGTALIGWSQDLPQLVWAGGSIYPEADNPEVRVVDELLLLRSNGATLTAAVLYRLENESTSDKNLVVGFPVFSTLVPVPLGEWAPSLTGWSLATLGLLTGRAVAPSVDMAERRRQLVAADDKRRELTWKAFRQELDTLTTDKEGHSLEDPAAKMLDVAVATANTPVPVERVVLESRLVREQGSAGGVRLEVTWRFLFHLSFRARATLPVAVRYSVQSFYGIGGGYVAPGVYVLGTDNRTWKGPIGAFYAIGEEPMQPVPAGFTSYESGGEFHVRTYVARDYQAGHGERLLFKVRDTVFGNAWGNSGFVFGNADGLSALDAKTPVSGDVPKKPFDPAIRIVGASSFLAGSTTIVIPGQEGPEWWRTTYGPEALFDGNPINAWVEGANASGIGEYVEFDLDALAVGLTVYNGLTMIAPAYLGADIGGVWYGLPVGKNPVVDQLASIWKANNRVKDLEIARVGGTKVPIVLSDSQGAQTFGGFFPPGRYRATIKGVYRGSRWDDTCLGELSFHTVPHSDVIRDESPELWKVLLSSPMP